MNLRSIVYSIVIVLSIVFTTACQEDTYVSDAERIAAEERLFLQFLDENFDTYKNDSAVANRTFGSKDVVDLVYWEKETGVGNDTDTIKSGQKVGYRYKLYALEYNSDTDSVDLKLADNQYNDPTPVVSTIDERNSQGYLTSYFGINEGLQHMKLNGKAWMLIPSAQTSGDYYSRFYEIEVVYVSR